MLSSGNIRIAFAVAVSLLVHGMLLAFGSGKARMPIAGLAPKKVSLQLVSRRGAPDKPPPPIREKAPPSRRQSLPALAPPVEVVVREIPPVSLPGAPVVPELEKDPERQEKAAVAEELAGPAGSAESAVVMARPLYLENPPPEYPALARRRYWQGTVVLDVLVSRQGKVIQLEVSKSSGRQVLDQAAFQAVRNWSFEPGIRSGSAIDMRVLVPVRFSLK